MHRRLLILCLFPCIAAAPRDWSIHPAIVEVEQPKTIYAVGDVHGDVDRLTDLLVAEHLIESHPPTPDKVHWTGGNAVLVNTGDMIDKYEQSVAVIELMRALQAAARQAKGDVIVTMGNHEAEFLASHGRDEKSKDFIGSLNRAHLDPAQVAEGDDAAGIGQWLRDLPIGAKVGDWFFCHAGNTQGLTVKQLDDQVSSAVDRNGYDVPILVDPNSILEARMHPRPWWEWDGTPVDLHATPLTTPHPNGETVLRRNLDALGVKHLVFGHQPGKMKFADKSERLADTIDQHFNGAVFFIDVGMSRGVDGGEPALLKIERHKTKGDKAEIDSADGKSADLWPK